MLSYRALRYVWALNVLYCAVIFFGFVIFRYIGPLAEKKQSPRKKFYTRKFFRRGKKDFFQIQCQVYRNDPRQILYNFDFFVQELQFFSIFDELSTEMKNKKNSKCRVRNWKKLFSPKFNVKYIEMIPVKFSATLIFSSWNFNFFNFRWTVHRDEKMTKSQKKFCNGKKFSILRFSF